MQRTTLLLALLALLAPGPPPSLAQELPAQQVHRSDFVPVGAEELAILAQFYDLDASLPLDARTVEEWETDSARFAKIVFTTQSGERVPGDLALPKVGQAPFPCVLLLHGLGSHRDRWWREDREALPEGLLGAGIAVLTIDLRFHGERSAANDYQSPVFLTMGDDLFVRSRDMGIQSTIDARRALAYLRQHGDVDGGRLAVIGYSMGAMIALRLAALEDDLVAVVASAVPTTEQPQPSDPFHFAPRAAAPVLLQIGRSDWLSSPADAETLLGLLPAEGNELRFYEAGHRLPAQFASDAAAWLGARLRAAPAEAAAAGLEQRIDRYLEPYLDAGHLSGTLLVARGGEVLYERSFGLADREHGVPNTPRTRFCVGSINKPMTIVILARLLEEGKLSLDARLAGLLPGFPRADEITVDHLLRHRAGIPHRVTGPLDETRPQTPATMVELAAGEELTFDPGSDSSYSSAGFSVLARVLELAAGRPYSELLADYVLRPAGMVDTSDAGSRAVLERRAASYSFDVAGLVNPPPRDISYLVGAGSVYSTARDLLALQRALLAGELGATARELLVGEGGSLAWNGSAHGFRAFADHDAATGVSVIVTSNLTSGALDRLRGALPKIAAGEDVAAPPPLRAVAADVDPELLASYQGLYELRPGRNLELRVVDGRVRMDDWLLVPTSKTTLFSPQDYAEIEVVLDDGGEVRRLDWTIGGETYPLTRVGPAPVE